MKTGPAGRELIQRNEGLRLDAYQDSVGVWTIGYGHTGPEVVPGLRITQEQADQWFAERLADEFEPGVEAAIGDAPTTQAQFDAMVSLAYNIGIVAFARSSVAASHRRGDNAKAADDFLMWNKAGGQVLAGLVRRRGEERKLYLSDAALAESRPEPDFHFVLQFMDDENVLHELHLDHFQVVLRQEERRLSISLSGNDFDEIKDLPILASRLMA